MCFPFGQILNLHFAHPICIKPLTLSFDCPLQAFLVSPRGWSSLLGRLTFSFAHSSLNQYVLVNTSLDSCNTFLVSSSALFSPTFLSSVCVTDRRFCKISRALSILISDWVTVTFKTSSFLDLNFSFLSPVIFITIQCFHHSPHHSTSQVSTKAVPFKWVLFSDSLPIQLSYFLMGKFQIYNPDRVFPDHSYSSVGFELEFSKQIIRTLINMSFTWFFLYIFWLSPPCISLNVYCMT